MSSVRSENGPEPKSQSLHDVSVVVVGQPSLGGSVLSVLIGRGEAGGEAAIGCPGSGSAFLQNNPMTHNVRIDSSGDRKHLQQT